jgi:hypothetical protein
VTALSARNAWAVGSYQLNSQDRRLILHWNGTRWQQVPSPASGELTSVTATSARNAWAVGETKAYKTLIIHWNGSAWK